MPALGGKLKLVISGAAPLPQEQEEFIRTSLCCNAGQGYGLTETCSASAVALPDRPDMMGTVGPVQTCADFCVESVPEMGYDARAVPIRGELLLRGPCLFSSYWRDPVGTREVLDEGGWFHTGDIVEVVEPSGALRIIDRKKNLVKLAQGEYVAVEAVETCLLGRTQDMVQALWVYGDPLQRRLVAVAVPHKHYLQVWADRVKVGSGEGGSAEGGAGGLGAWQRLCASPSAAAHVLELLQSAAKAAHLNSISTPAAGSGSAAKTVSGHGLHPVC
ncbi:AMP-binding domain-containing protein [Haematococcus lacustris]|uniref:AMP-binding domain-containing protein n=1 Tax=Haematococcus lacustris TaxID=44745 RepID=A0A699Z3D5_HAELA|nr:AMP-binding domain-containing protein [Haematococcus lacustris]